MTSSIFRNRSILSPKYVPESLAHREDALKMLNSLFSDAPGSPSLSLLQTVQLIGPLGSGKTSVMQVFGRSLEQEADRAGTKLRHIYINLKEHGGTKTILYRHLLDLVVPGAQSFGLSAAEILTQMLAYLRQSKVYVLLSMDEVDTYLKGAKNTSVIYDLTRLNENSPDGSCNILGVIFAARSTGFHDKLDDAEKSSLGRIPIFFRPYTASEIEDILSDRIDSAFRSGAISSEILRFVANAATLPPSRGDARYALDLLHYAGNYAEAQGADKVTVEHVRSVISQIYPTITQEDILNLPTPEHALALLSVVLSLRGTRETYCSFKEIKAQAEILEKTRSSFDPISVRLDELLQDLVDKRIIQMQSFKEIGIQGAPIDSLFRFLDKAFTKMESKSR